MAFGALANFMALLKGTIVPVENYLTLDTYSLNENSIEVDVITLL